MIGDDSDTESSVGGHGPHVLANDANTLESRAGGGPDVSRDLADLYRTHRAFVQRVTRQLGVAPPATEDVVHDVFVVASTRLEDYEGRGTMRSWLYGITRRVVLHHHRSRRRSEARLGVVRDEASRAEPALDPERQAARIEAADLVQRFIDRLGPAKREAFVLSEVEGMTAPEIADATGLNLNTIYARIRAVRKEFEREVGRAQRQRNRRRR